MALLIQCSEGRSVKQFTAKFYPLLDEKGWRSAVSRYAGYKDIDAFYDAFAVLMEKSENEQMKLLRLIKP